MNYLRNFLHFRLILPLQRYVIIIIFVVAVILQHLNERRKLHTRWQKCRGFQESSGRKPAQETRRARNTGLPDKTLAMLMNALAVRVSLLKHTRKDWR